MDNTLKYNKPWILQRADPYVYRHTDGAYYFTASVPEYDRIVLRKSDTLAGLETADETEIWHKHESGPQSIHIGRRSFIICLENGISTMQAVIRMTSGQ